MRGAGVGVSPCVTVIYQVSAVFRQQVSAAFKQQSADTGWKHKTNAQLFKGNPPSAG